MPKSETSLKKLLHEIRRISAHREVLTEEKIKAIYKNLEKELNSFLGETYIKYGDKDGRLFMSYLDAQRKRAKFLEEIVEHCDTISKPLKKELMSLVDETYSRCYMGMAEAVKKADEAGKLAEIAKELSVQPDVLKQAVNNNISKLTLSSVMEKHRQEIIYQTQQALVVGMINGDRYEQMARRIAERTGVSQSKAMNIARTETHRNIESGFMDCAENLSERMQGSELIYAATWQTMQDERVRPQIRKKTKSGWKTYRSKNGADHIKMQGVTVKVGDLFELGYINGRKVTAKAPSQSGVAAHDCHCRCYLEYNLMTIEEFEKATGKPVNIAAMPKSTRQQMNENGIADCELERTTDNQRFSSAIDAAKKANPRGGSVDPVSPEKAATYKCFLAKNDMAGVAVKADGDITAVFKNSNWQQRGAVNDLIITARANGGVKMDCYGVGLVNMYEKCGYVPVARIPFNADYVDDAFLLETRPDVYVLMKNTDSIEEVIEKNAKKAYTLSTQEELDSLLTFEDYDEALEYRDKLLREQEGK